MGLRVQSGTRRIYIPPDKDYDCLPSMGFSIGDFIDNGVGFQVTMIAGFAGISDTRTGEPMTRGEVGVDTLQPMSD